MKCFWVYKHVRGLHVVAEEYKGSTILSTVLWDKLCELMMGNKLLLSNFRIVGEVALGLKVGEMLVCD